MHTIRNPLQWTVDQFRTAAHHAESMGHSVAGARDAGRPEIRRIGLADLREALAMGVADLGAFRTDVVFLCIVYPLVGLVLVHAAFNYDMLPLIFPLASGFALIGPAVAVGLYEMSRRRELGMATNWADAFAVTRASSFGAILLLSAVLLFIFLVWLGVANAIYRDTMGPAAPASIDAFASDLFATEAGREMIVFGTVVGFVFALTVLAISVVSFPMLLDRDVGFGAAVATSVRATFANPVPVAAWGVIVAAGLVIGSLPFLLGLVVVMPVLGHATWHLYRRMIPR